MPGKRVTEKEAREWIERYEAGETASAIAASAGRGTTTVLRSMEARGTRLRTQSEAALNAQRQHPSQIGFPRGEEHWNWRGGTTARPDLNQFLFKNAKRERWEMAGGRCEECGRKARTTHHVNGPGDDSVENLRALCHSCHSLAHGGWPPDEDLVADWESGVSQEKMAAKYGVNIGTAMKYQHYARGLARGKRLA
jgi:5-methylcytosine-specific restriction endonuclease McrA